MVLTECKPLLMIFAIRKSIPLIPKHVINIHPQLFPFVFNVKNAGPLNHGKVQKLAMATQCKSVPLPSY